MVHPEPLRRMLEGVIDSSVGFTPPQSPKGAALPVLPQELLSGKVWNQGLMP